MVLLKKGDGNHLFPELEVKIDDGLGFTVSYFGWPLPPTHQLYKDVRRSLRYTTLSQLINRLNEANFCQGTETYHSGCSSHVLLQQNKPGQSSDTEDEGNPFDNKTVYRQKNCWILLENTKATCANCSSEKKASSKRIRNSNVPAKSKAPISITNPERIKLTIRDQRLKIKNLKTKLSEMEIELKKNSIPVDSNLDKDILTIMSNKDNMSPFMQLFWQQQKKAFERSSTGVKYHPMIIRFCLSLQAKSASCYEELRNSGILKLPSQRTLRDYKNAIHPKRGFNEEIISELKDLTDKLFDTQRYVALSFDEMKIQAGLVFDKYTGALIGFVDLGDPETNYAVLEECELASHVMVLYIRGLQTDLKFALANFGTKGITAYQLVPIFWKAVGILEVTCNLWVVSATSDGASQNRKFYKMHFGISADKDESIVFRVKNLFALHRHIHFFSDAPHLVKTARNCLYSSGFGSSVRLMWNNGKYLVWDHIRHVFTEDLERPLHLLPRLKMEHIKLTSFSKMRVDYAAQVLSETMSSVLAYSGKPEYEATATFCKYLDKFFDCCNVRNQTEGHRSRKEFREPYTTLQDKRFQWLNEFMEYLDTWKESITDRNDQEYTQTEKAKMYLSHQTDEGLRITSRSLIEATKFLLREGFQFVLTERFCQDVVEEYFGRQRAMGRRDDNPDLKMFGYNDNTIRTQRSSATVMGNTRGAAMKRKKSWFIVDEKPLKKRCK